MKKVTMKKVTKKKAKKFVCPVIYDDGVSCASNHTKSQLIEMHGADKSTYKFHPKYHGKKPKKAVKKWTGWGVFCILESGRHCFIESWGTRKAAKENAGARADILHSSIKATYYVSKIEEL